MQINDLAYARGVEMHADELCVITSEVIEHIPALFKMRVIPWHIGSLGDTKCSCCLFKSTKGVRNAKL